MQNLDHHAVISGLRKELDQLPFEQFSLVSFKGKPIMKRGFFPGGNGLYNGEAASYFPHHGTLILGSNFGKLDGFIDSDERLITQDETTGKTWTPLKRLLIGASIELQECFFTNAWPCLHVGNRNTVNELIPEWLGNKELMEYCGTFFATTCAVTKPSLIVALGPGPAAFLGGMRKGQLNAWSLNSVAGFNRLPIASIQLEDVEHKTVCVGVVHPCYQHINAKRREPPYQGADGEVELLRRADQQRNAILVNAQILRS